MSAFVVTIRLNTFGDEGIPMAKPGVFDLPSGRHIRLRELRQYHTYEGLLEGLPTAENNKKTLEWLIANNSDKEEGGAFLISPTETPIDFNREGRPYPFGTPSAMPAVTCIGRFFSFQPARNSSKDFSGLLIIWFQEEFAFPIDPGVIEKLLAIDWDSNAVDQDY